MRKKRPVRQRHTRPARAPREPMQWRYPVLTAACGAMLLVGFFFAARQHFASIDFGIKNSTLRKQIEELESEKRRLLLTKEVALSPAALKKAARKIGYFEVTATEPLKIAATAKEKPAVEKAADKVLPVKRDFGGAKAIPALLTEPAAKPQRPVKIEKQAKKENPAKEKKDRS